MLIYVIWNLFAFALMGYDKRQAKKGGWRVKENTLMLCAICMGGVGILAGMYVFRHKTRHEKFKLIVPVSILLNAVVIYYTIAGYNKM